MKLISKNQIHRLVERLVHSKHIEPSGRSWMTALAGSNLTAAVILLAACTATPHHPTEVVKHAACVSKNELIPPAIEQETRKWIRSTSSFGGEGRGDIEIRQQGVDALLALDAMTQGVYVPDPYLFSVRIAAPREDWRFIRIAWIGSDDRLIPAMQIIGKYGKVVAQLDAWKWTETGEKTHWYRSFAIIPIINGEKDAELAAPLSGRWAKVRIRVDSLNQIDGIRFLNSDGSFSRLVRPWMSDGIIANQPNAQTRPSIP